MKKFLKIGLNHNIIDKLQIVYNDTAEYPAQFSVNIDNKTYVFHKLHKNEYHPISRDDTYTVDSNNKVIKLNLDKNIHELYSNGKSVATLVKNNDRINPFRLVKSQYIKIKKLFLIN